MPYHNDHLLDSHIYRGRWAKNFKSSLMEKYYLTFKQSYFFIKKPDYPPL